ncbi:MAG: hypothetical protein O7C75_17645, partial [Verrucomicrobia bacterium]|nr:hypothetical protein [Verrucomicrobiota bacterium]
MKSIRFLLTSILLILSSLGSNGADRPPVVSSSTPNIILCMADDQGWEEVGRAMSKVGRAM